MSAGLTQERPGFALGITKSSVSAWENGRETPSFRLLPLLREELGRSLDDLICDAGVPRVSAEHRGPPPSDSGRATSSSELALLTRYRHLPARKREALLELIKPA